MLKRVSLLALAITLAGNPLWSQDNSYALPLETIAFPPLTAHEIDERCGALFQAMKSLSSIAETDNQEMWQEFSSFFFEMGARRLGQYSVVAVKLPENMRERAIVSIAMYEESMNILGLIDGVEAQIADGSADHNLFFQDSEFCFQRLDSYADGSLDRPT